MKSIFLINNQIKYLTHKKLTFTMSKTFSLMQRNMNSLNFSQDLTTLSLNDNLDNKFPLTLKDEIVLENITQDITLVENNEYDERNIENENSKIQIEMKGRNSKTPKRVKISILYFNLIFPRLIMVQDLAHR
jgi:hypothetical protein